ncbi:hypothetical protein SAMN02745116_00371 [Pilibacter termitis]|uniref:Uncharacterized protein n=1 Tax=Pilibacter termitis TaxID=263852 RepID=A0A1T4KT87_9ENTE|nr:hypothetical protein [Pilibacter termitis]SJZ45570.1 hypothetical protein SAMN02745116_00371 [Pilibacter termitis]
MGFFSKKQERFELLHGVNVQESRLRDAVDLINWAEKENAMAMELNTSSSVVVVKYNHKEEMVYGMKLTFPMDEDTDFDELLQDFYTKKPIDFDETILEKATIVEPVQPSNATPPMPSEFQQLAQKGQENLQEIPVMPEETPSPTPEQLALENMQAQFLAQQEEMAALKKQLEERIPTPAPEIPVAIHPSVPIEKTELTQKVEETQLIPSVSEMANLSIPPLVREEDSQPISEKKTEDTPRNSPVSSIAETSFDFSTDDAVQDVLFMVKSEFDKALSDFITKETLKIEEEIKQLDKREQIAADMTKRFESEKDAALLTKSAELVKKKETAIQEENRRHEETILQIEADFTIQRKEALETIQVDYQAKLEEKIAAEYQRQTEQLKRILQGKTDELQLRQKTINAGLKNNFQEVLATFNTKHNQVIENVEKRKEPIDFVARMKKRA